MLDTGRNLGTMVDHVHVRRSSRTAYELLIGAGGTRPRQTPFLSQQRRSHQAMPRVQLQRVATSLRTMSKDVGQRRSFLREANDRAIKALPRTELHLIVICFLSTYNVF